MNRYYLNFLLKRDLKYYKVPVPMILGILVFGQLCTFASMLHTAYRELLRIVVEDPVHMIGHWEPDPELTAASLPELLDRSGMLTSAVIALILLLALAVPCFLSDTKDGKNIATLMRMPVSRLHYAGIRVLLPAAVLGIFLVTELLVCLICLGLYHLVIPAECLPADIAPWASEFCRIFFPAADPGRFPSVILSAVFFPAAVLCCLIAARGRDPLCIIAGSVSLLGCLLFFIPGTICSILFPVIAVFTVLFCGWAVCRRRIF